jgi:bacterioferritin-associated ferredoxin
MIVCSCNVFSDHQVRSTIAAAGRRPRMSQIYGGLNSSAKCGRCARTIKRVIDDTQSDTIGSASLSMLK